MCGEYLKKGRGVRVVGRLKQDRWTDADGKGRSRIFIVAEHVEFKPQLKKLDDDGKDGESGAAEGQVEAAPTEQVQEEAELKEAASF